MTGDPPVLVLGGGAGRSGCFACQNMHHAIRSGIDTARQLLGGDAEA